MASLQVKELSAKLADAESKKAAFEARLALKDRASEVRVFHDVFAISLFQRMPIHPCRTRMLKYRS